MISVVFKDFPQQEKADNQMSMFKGHLILPMKPFILG